MIKRNALFMAGIRKLVNGLLIYPNPPSPVSSLPNVNFTIPPQFFGLNMEFPNPTGITFGAWRNVDSFTDWESIEQTHTVIDPTQKARLDAHIADHITNNRDVLYTLNRTPAWASSHPTDANPGAWAPTNLSDLTTHINWFLTTYAPSFVGKTSKLFLEGRNEPDFSWLDTMANLVAVQQTLWNAVQAYNTAHGTSIQVISPSFSTGAHVLVATGGTLTVEGFFNAGGYSYCDIIGFHPYSPGDVNGNIGFDRTSLVTLASALGSAGISKPVFVTEIGRSLVVSATATEFTQDWLYMAGLGITKCCWYSYDIPGVNNMMVNQVKPAFTNGQTPITSLTIGWVNATTSSTQLGALLNGVATVI